MPVEVLYFSLSIVVLAVIAFFIVMSFFREDINSLVTMMCFEVIFFVTISTYGKSLVINFAATVGQLQIRGTYGDPEAHFWESVIIVAVMAGTALFAMLLRHRLEMRPKKLT